MADARSVRTYAQLRRREKETERAARRALSGLEGIVRDRLDPAHPDPSVLDSQDPEWMILVDDELVPVIRSVFLAGLAQQVREGTPDAQPYAVAHLDTVRNRLAGVADAVFDSIRLVLTEGIAAGDSITELAARVDEWLTDEERWSGRARTIARTEVIAANNAGAREGARFTATQLGLDGGEVVKEWLATPGPRTRDTHERASGQRVTGIDTEFRVGHARLLQPGDPTGPPEEVINCRCTVLYLLPGDPGYPRDVTASAGLTFDVSTMPEQLQDYWTHGEGAARIGWGAPGDFNRCRTNLRGKVPGHMIDGTCANLHKQATGSWPGEAAGRTVTAAPLVEPPADVALPPDVEPSEPDPDECTCCAGSGDHDCGHDCLCGDGTRTSQAAVTDDGLEPGDPILCAGHHGRPDPSGAAHDPEHFDDDRTPDGTPTAGDTQEPDVTAAASTEGENATGPATDTLTWVSVFAPEGLRTGDKRKFREGGIEWLNTPGTLMAQFQTAPGHDNAVAVGVIQSVQRDGNLIRASGTWDTGPDAIEARRQNIGGMMRGVSVDLDDVELSWEDDDGNPIDGESMFELMMEGAPEPTMVVERGRLRAATLCYIPAYVEAYLLDSTVADEIPDTTIANSDGETGMAIAASAALTADAPLATAPSTAFANPGLTEPTRLTITDDGRVFGHLATWGTCHIGIDGACITPPSSDTDYAYFLTGMYQCSDGEVVPVGQLTMGTGHANLSLGWRPTVDHYDNTGTVAAYVNMGEDAIGIWFAGALAEHLPVAQRLALQRSGSVSGDWRAIGASSELVAALAVNVPGFPIPTVRSRVASGHQQALVASGVVTAPHDTPAPVDYARLAREVTAYQTRQARKDTAARRIRQARKAALAARL